MSRRTKWQAASLALVSLVFTAWHNTLFGQASAANPLIGAWSLIAVDPGGGSSVIAPSQPGLYVFADKYYSAVYTPGAEARVKSASSFQPTQEEMVAQYRTIIVNAGTYEISGSSVTFRPMIAKSPGFVGGHQTSTFRVQGDTLVLTMTELTSVDGVSPPNVSGSLTLVRAK